MIERNKAYRNLGAINQYIEHKIQEIFNQTKVVNTKVVYAIERAYLSLRKWNKNLLFWSILVLCILANVIMNNFEVRITF